MVRRLPVALMEYPFESFTAVLGLLGAVAVFTAGVPGPMGELPAIVIILFGLMLALAGGTLALGLRRSYRLALPIGLRLLGLTIGTYAVGDVMTGGPAHVPNALILIYIAALALSRSLYLRAATEVRHRHRVMRGGR